MYDIWYSDLREMFMNLMRGRALYYKEAEKGVKEMCQIMEDMLEEERMKLARRLYKEGVSPEVIARSCDKPLEHIKEWLGLSDTKKA